MVKEIEKNPGILPLASFDRFIHKYAKYGWIGSRILWTLRNKARRGLPSNQVNQIILPNGFTMIFDSKDWTKRTVYEGTYQRALLNLLENIRFNGLVIDVGANVGITLWSMLQNGSYKTRYLAFEPSRQCKSELENLALRLPAPGKIYSFALGEKHETKRLYGLNNQLHSGLASLLDRADLVGDSEDVEVQTLDEVFSLEELDGEIFMLKLDAEGYEGNILKGANRLIKRGLIQSYIIEVSPNFGPIDYLNDLHDKLGHDYLWFEVKEVGFFRKKPTLEEILPDDLQKRDFQFDLYIVKRSIFQNQVKALLESRNSFFVKKFEIKLKNLTNLNKFGK